MSKHLQSVALLLTVVGAYPGPGAAQEGRQMAAFVSPNVACRLAPSPTGEVAGFVRWDENGVETARELRASLRDVADDDKAPLVELLDARRGVRG